MTDDVPIISDRMSIGKAKSVQKDSVGVGRWQRRSVGEGRFVVATLAVAALSVLALWGLWRHANAAAESSAASYGPTVRVGVVADATHVRMIAYGAFDLLSSAGRVVFTCAGSNVLRLTSVEGQSAASYYYVVVFELEKRRKPDAYFLLAQLRDKYKVGSEVLEVTQRLVLPQDRVGMGERLVVAVGPFDDLKLADQWRQYYSDPRIAQQWRQHFNGLRLTEEHKKTLLQAYRVYVVKDTSKRAGAEIHLYDHSDRLLARLKDSLTIRLKDEKQVVAAEVLKSPTAGWGLLARTSPRYRGSMEIRLNNQGRLTAVNTLSLEEYVNGIVPSEISGGAPYEALKAQAIAARSEAYHKLGLDHHINDLYDFCPHTHCQKYLGVEEQTLASMRAVAETRGQVLVFGRQVIDAVYCHSCGGVSADSTDVWRSSDLPFFQSAYDRRFWRKANLSDERAAEVWLRSQPDVYCNPSQPRFLDYAKKYFRWVRRIDGAALQRIINRERNIGQILDVQVAERTESGRVRVLRVVGSKGSIRFTGSESICAALNDLPSSFFVLEVDPDTAPPHAVKSLTIQGGGFGHGVGMCQMGAYMMATRGWLCPDILQHYYPGTSIGRVY